jgi:hypothetical protein
MNSQYNCFTCNSAINNKNKIYKAYDKNFCSEFCRSRILNTYNYSHECVLIKRNKSVNSLNSTFKNNVIIKDNNIINNTNNNIMKRDISNLETYVTVNSNKNRTCINTIVENYIKKYKIDVTRNSLKTINDITKKLNFINQYKN